jgi:hypothetical protein
VALTKNYMQLVFGSITLFEENESLLAKDLAKIIEVSLKQADLSLDPTNYLVLVKGLFHSIMGGKVARLSAPPSKRFSRVLAV